MAVKLLSVCFLAVALLGSLGSAQYFKAHPTQEPQRPQPPNPQQRPHDPQRPHLPVHPQPQRPQDPQKPNPPVLPQPQRPQDPQKPNPPVYPQPQRPQDPQRPSPPVYPQPQRPQDPQRPSPPVYPQPSPPRDPKWPSPPVYPQPVPPRDPQWPSPPVYPQPVPPRDPQKPSPPVYPQPVPPRDPQKPSPPFYPRPVPPQDPQKPSPPVYPQPVPPRDPQKPSPPFYPWPVPPQDPQKPSPPVYPQPVPPRDPQKPSPPFNPRPKDPNQPNLPNDFQSCEVEAQYKIQCGLPSITAAECKAINCCFDGQMCYYGKAVTLQCSKDAQFILVVARDATLPNIDLDSIHFMGNDQNCRAVDSSSAFAIFQFPVTSCGTTVTENESGVLTYENRISSSYEVAVGPYGAITRDSQFDLIIQCRYTGSAVEALVVEVGIIPPPPGVAAPGPLRVELRLGNGQCTMKGCVEEDVAYTSYYQDSDYPVTKVLRDPVYVEVRVLERTDPNLVLTLGRCWATSSPYPQSLPQWDLLINGCPYRDDRYQTTLVSVGASSGLTYPTHYRRFIFKMFTFVASTQSSPNSPPKDLQQDAVMTPLHEKVYIHCNTAVCQPTLQSNCEPRCFRKRREIAASVKSDSRLEATTVTSHGIIITDPSNNIQ